MAVHAGVPEKTIKAALKQLREDEALADVTWDMARSRPGRPIKIYFEAESMELIRAAKTRLEQQLNEAGFDLYP